MCSACKMGAALAAVEGTFALAALVATLRDASSCPLGGTPLPVWSRGLITCADISPKNISDGCELGMQVFAVADVPPRGVVYVPTCGMPRFVSDVFLRLSSNSSITLLTGGDDVGVPRELFSGTARVVGARRLRLPISLHVFLCDDK